ncbi:uncharacterized protein LOC132917263 [Rhopalosiphum padi]|uniref:uncharacterized protein LOC132917263 n=1 Tax=Rhopalosiphum padi TaxID=40932 RepID=UPI00298ECD9F|nr:uncharacterized protein LOC132917263 [Rhopalosiphum padi]
MATMEDSYCSCSTTGADDSCSCDRSIVHVLDLATPRFEVVVRQPSSDHDKLPSKRSQRAYKSMTTSGKTDVVGVNATDRKRFTTSTEADVHCNDRAPTREQRSLHSSEVVQTADRDSCSSSTTDGPQAPNPQLQRATDPRTIDFYTSELQVTDQRRESRFCVTDDPHAAKFYAKDFCAVIMPNCSDEFDAVDLTVNDYRQRSVDSWEERGSTIDSAQVRSMENGTWGTRVQTGDARKQKISLWTRVKQCIRRRLCCQQR